MSRGPSSVSDSMWVTTDAGPSGIILTRIVIRGWVYLTLPVTSSSLLSSEVIVELQVGWNEYHDVRVDESQFLYARLNPTCYFIFDIVLQWP